MARQRQLSALLAIGPFARACRLHIKQLRHYDELGLLKPARVDASGYRYYARAQARDAITIALLRSLDVPLGTIRTLLHTSTPAGIAAALEEERARIERDLARAKHALFCVDRIIRDGAILPYEVQLREEPARELVYVEAVTTPELHVEAGFELFDRLRAALAALGVPLVAPVICLLPEASDEDAMILQLGSVLEAPVDAAALARVDARTVTLPAGPFAFVTHRGPYEELGLAQHAIAAWVEETGRETAGPTREIYVDDPAVVPPADVVTEVGVPLAR